MKVKGSVAKGHPIGVGKTLVTATDGSAWLANKGQTVSIYHIPSGYQVAFKAMMTSFSDSYKSDWQSENVYGRMDPLQSFKQTSRTISLAFNVVASGYDEAKMNFQRLSALQQFLYPTYDAHGLIKNSPFCKISFMNFATSDVFMKGQGDTLASWTGLMGTIDGVTFEPDFDMGVFQLPGEAYNSYEGGGGPIYPKLFNVSFSFVVLHDEYSRPGWNETNNPISSKFPYGENIRSVAEPGSTTEYFKTRLARIQDTKIPNHPKKEATKKKITESTTSAGGSFAMMGVNAPGQSKPKESYFDMTARQTACRKGLGPCG